MSTLAAKIKGQMRGGGSWWVGLLVLVCVFGLPNILASQISTIWLQFPGIDKPTHFVAFLGVFLAIYGVTLNLPWLEQRRNKLGVAVGISLSISLADEAQQAMLGLARTAELGDLVADAVGVFVGLVCVNVEELGIRRAATIGTVLLVILAIVTAKTYQDLNHYYRGMAYEREQDYQQARLEYQLAADSGFQSATLYNAIAWLDIEFLGADPVVTERYAARALAMAENNPDVLDTYGWVLVRAGRAQEGLSFLERAWQLKPTIYCIDLHLGEAYRQVGDRRRAREFLTRQINRSSVDRWGRSAAAALDRLEGVLE